MPVPTIHAGKTIPVVYTVSGCEACHLLTAKWTREGIKFEEIHAEQSDELMDEAREFGSMVPIVVWPDGTITDGLSVDGAHCCYI